MSAHIINLAERRNQRTQARHNVGVTAATLRALELEYNAETAINGRASAELEQACRAALARVQADQLLVAAMRSSLDHNPLVRT